MAENEKKELSEEERLKHERIKAFLDKQEFILNVIDSKPSILTKDILGLKTFGDKRASCPFHNSKDGDFSYVTENRFWYCFGRCSCSYGDSIQVHAMVENSLSIEQWKGLPKDTKKKLRRNSVNYLYERLKNNKVTSLKKENIQSSSIFDSSNGDISYIDYLEQAVAINFPLLVSYKNYKNKWANKNNKEEVKSLRELLKNFPFKESDWDRYSEEAKKRFFIKEVKETEPKFLQNYHFYLIHNEIGRLVSAQGRRKDDVQNDKFVCPKMYNFPDFKKNEVLYGLYQIINDHAINGVVPSEAFVDEISIHEGQGDSIRAFEHGYKNSISLMGRTMSEPQLNLLKRVLKKKGNLIIFLDNDVSGIKSSLKIVTDLIEDGYFENVYLTKMKDGFKDVGESTKESFFKALNSKQKINKEWLKINTSKINDWIEKQEKKTH